MDEQLLLLLLRRLMLQLLLLRFSSFVFNFETGAHSVARVVLELTIYIRLASNSQRSSCLYLCLP